MEIRHVIQWAPKGRLLEYALFFMVKPDYLERHIPARLVLFGYRHWYEGGGCWADTYFKIVHGEEKSTSVLLLCKDPDDNELTDIEYKPVFVNTSEDKVVMKEINTYVREWIEWSEESDCLIVKKSMQGKLHKDTLGEQDNVRYSSRLIDENDPIYLLIEKAFAG